MTTSGLYPFYQIVENIKQETGIQNLRNRYPEIRQMIARAEYEINPYAAFLLRKKMIFYKGNGNFDGKNIKKPADFVSIDKVGCCEDGLCDGKYYETISHIVICDNEDRNKITFTYWALNYDGEGNPVVTYNHAEAVTAFCIWKMYTPKVFLGQGSANVKKDFQNEFNDRAAEARGEDFFPSASQLCKIWQVNKMSSYDFEMLGCQDYCHSCECLTTIEEPVPIDPPEVEKKVWWWQDNSLNQQITQVGDITQGFLDSKAQITLTDALAGYTFSYLNVGRIGFCIEDVDDDQIDIYDLLQVEMSDNMIKFYNPTKRWLIYISRDYLTPSSIYFKFQDNE